VKPIAHDYLTRSMEGHRSGRKWIDSRYYLAPVAGAGWLAGIWLGAAVRWPPLLWFYSGALCTIGAAFLWRRGRAGLALAGVAALAMGGARYSAAQPPLDPAHLHYYNGMKNVVVLGVVEAEPEVHDTFTQLLVSVSELVIDDRSVPVSGAILVRARRYPPIGYGDTVRARGDIDDPVRLGSSGYAGYLKRIGVLSVMGDPSVEVTGAGGGSPVMRTLLRLKDRGRQTIDAILPEPHAALLTGILLGDDSGMPRALSDDFRRTGMTHIIAISGFNIAILIALLDRATGPLLPRRQAAIAIMIFLALYAAMVGASASVVRATLMGITYLVGKRLLGRPTMVMAGMFTAAFLITLAQPAALWDVGFQLSFAATVGLILYVDPWAQRLDRGLSPYLTPDARSGIMRFMTEVGIVTLAAQALTLPLLLYHFGRLSLASIPANFLVLPAQPGVMATGGIATLTGLISPLAGRLAGLAAWLFLHYTIVAIRLLARMPGASVPFSLSSAGLVVIYLFIAAATLMAGKSVDTRRISPSRRRASDRRFTIGLTGLALVAILISVWLANRPDGRLHVVFLDVGQGDAIFIQTPAGRQALVDGGRYPSVALDQLGRQMPFWDHSIDMVVATHPDADHIAGLVAVLERYRVSRLITNGAADDSDPLFGALLQAAEAGDVPIMAAQAGETLILDDGVRMEILNAGSVDGDNDRNESSIVAMLTYGQLSVLLTGDAEAAAESRLLQSGRELQAVVLKAGHHGANTSSGEDFLRAVEPQFVVISAGRDNGYGHPHPAMLERAAAVGAVILRTDRMGAIEVESDGQRMWWEVERLDPIAAPP